MPEQVQEQPKVKCALHIAMMEDGSLAINIDGSEQNLVIAEGLLVYAQRHLEKTWNERVS